MITINNYLPIINPLTDSQYEQLKILLTIKSTEQISTLQRIKIKNTTNLQILKPSHQLNK